MITYNEIYEASRKERYSEQLQSLPKNFIASVAEYLREKKEMSSKEDDTFSDMITKTKKQLENAVTLFNELKRIRRRKILDLVLIASETGISKRDFDNMLDFEKELFEDFMKCIDVSDKKFNQLLVNGNGGSKSDPVENEMVVFKQDSDEFLGPDGEMMGPFKKGQIANLPLQITKILIDDGRAQKVE
jgi:DNA replication initiation complex subunit (GINS family)